MSRVLAFNKSVQSLNLNKQEWGCFWLAMALHLLLSIGIELSPDEAHYALYGLHLDWSYFDHPPLVGWVQWLPAHWPQLDWSLRLIPMLCWALSAFLLIGLNQTFKAFVQTTQDEVMDGVPKEHEHETGLASISSPLLLISLSPLLHLLGIALVPDTLLMPLVCAIMLTAWRLINENSSSNLHAQSQLGTWCILGFLLGLAGLSKYTAVVMAVSVALVLLKEFGFSLWRQRGLWFSVLLACVMILPVLYWNGVHHWISFAYQFGHASGQQSWVFRKSFAYFLVLILAYGPLLVVGLLYLRDRTRSGLVFESKPYVHLNKPRVSVEFFCLAFGLPILFLLVLLSGKGSTLPHWAAPAWVSLIPLASLGLDRFRWVSKRLFKALVYLQVFFCLALFALMLCAGIGKETPEQAAAAPGLRSEDFRVNPFADLFGWKDAARVAQQLAQINHIEDLAVTNWTLASRLAWYAKPLPVKVIQNHHDQFNLWFGELNANETVLWVDWSMMTFSPPVADSQFKSCHLIEQMPVMHMGRVVSHFNFSICEGWQSTRDSVSSSDKPSQP